MNKKLPPLDELSRVISYDPETGIFINLKMRSASALAGTVTGCKNKKTGYLVIRHRKELYLAHRLAWLFVTSDDPRDLQVDHINGDPADNRFCNLRLATPRQNLLNGKRPVTNTTGVKGVVRVRRGRFLGRIRTETGFRYTRSFRTVEEAAEAYAVLAKEVAGEFVRQSGDKA